MTVNVLDINDNDPYFDPEEYPIGISESTSVNSTIVRVLAFDDDIGINAELTYQISSGGTNGEGLKNIRHAWECLSVKYLRFLKLYMYLVKHSNLHVACI